MDCHGSIGLWTVVVVEVQGKVNLTVNILHGLVCQTVEQIVVSI